MAEDSARPNSDGAVTPEPGAGRAPGSRRRRWLWIGAGVVVAALILSPIVSAIISSVVRGAIIEGLEGQLGGTATVESVSVSWTGRFDIVGLALRTSSGDDVLTLGRAHGRIGPWSAVVRNRIQGSLHLEETTVVLEEDEQGRLGFGTNVPSASSGAVTSTPDATSPAPDPGSDDSAGSEGVGDPFPRLGGRVEISGLRVLLRNASGISPVVEVNGSATITEGLLATVVVTGAAEATFEASLPGGDHRGWAPTGDGSWETVEGRVDIDLTSLDLEKMPAALLSPVGLRRARGSLSGRTTLSHPGPHAADLTLRGFHAEPIDGGAPVHFETATLKSERRADTVFFDHHLSIGSVDGSVVEVSATTEPGGPRATLQASGDVRAIQDALGGLLPVRDGVQLSGALDLTAAADARDGAGGATSVTASGGLQNLTARDAGGVAIPMSSVVTLDLAALLADEGGSRVEGLRVDAGSVQVEGRGGVDGLGAALPDSTLRLNADLDALSRTVAAVFDTDLRFGGELVVDVVPGEARAVGTELRLSSRATAVRFASGEWEVRPTTLSVSSAAILGAEEAGATLLEGVRVTLASTTIVTGADSSLRVDPIELTAHAALRDRDGGTRMTAHVESPSIIVRDGEDTIYSDRSVVLDLDATRRPEDRIELTIARYQGERLDGDLRGTVEGTGDHRVGHFDLVFGKLDTMAFQGTGDVDIDIQGPLLRVQGGLDVNNGRLDLAAELDLRDAPDARSTLALKSKDLEANSRIADLLAVVHPIFATAGTAVDGLLDGKVVGDLDAVVSGPLTSDDDDTPPLLDRLGGRGHLEIHDFVVRGTPLLAQVLAALDIESPEGIELNPVDFTVADGRLSYDRPMQIQIDGHRTFWVGSVGLDETLDLTWEVPITEELAERQPRFEPLVGETIRVPVGGTSRSPRLDWRRVLDELLVAAARKGVQDAARKGLGDILGEGGEGRSASELLAKADELWDQGKKKRAARLYRKIREEHDQSWIYKLNKDRIRERSQGP